MRVLNEEAKSFKKLGFRVNTNFKEKVLRFV